MLVVIGPHWAETKDGEPKLQAPDDFVRREIEQAFEHGSAIIPVLVDETPMPRAATLPVSIRGLADQQATSLRNDHFADDFANLARAVRETLGLPPRTRLWPSVLLGGLLLGAAAAWGLRQQTTSPTPETASEPDVTGPPLQWRSLDAVGGPWQVIEDVRRHAICRCDYDGAEGTRVGYLADGQCHIGYGAGFGHANERCTAAPAAARSARGR